MAHKLTTCTFCGVGCGIYLETAGNQVVGAYPSMSHPTNGGRICVRGWHVHEVASSPDRLTTPLIKKGGRLEPVSWEEALGFVARRLQEIRRQHGPDAIAFLNSPRCSNEESYLLQKLARAVVGTNNVDHGTGVYCNNSISVLLKMLGVPATTNSVQELAGSEVIFVDGVDLARQLPTIGGVVIRARLQGARLVVIDARRHRVAESADLFLQIKPGTETVLYGAMAKVIIDRGLANLPFIKARCADYDVFQSRIANYDLMAAAEHCGVGAELIEAAALSYARARSAAILYSTGIQARESASVEAIVNLALLTGQLGKEGAGIFALTEHNNLQGACDMGMLPDRLPGYRSVEDERARREVEQVWGGRLPATPGLSAGSVLTDLGQGRVRAAWLCRYDPVRTAVFGDAAGLLTQCDLVVIQHLFLTETARHADVVLPTAAFGEERVTFTSTERRIQLADKVIEPPAGATPAWVQLVQVAQALGADWRFASTAEIMEDIGRTVPFYSGATHENLAREYGRQWPCTREQPLGTRFLFGDSHAEGQFRFAPPPEKQRLDERLAPVAGGSGSTISPNTPGQPSADHPFTLVFGNSLYYWNQNILIQHSETLKREYRILLLDYPEGFVEINTDDAKKAGIRDGQRVRLRAREGAVVVAARVTPEVRAGAIFVPYFVREVQQQIHGAPGRALGMVPVRLEREGT